MGRDVSDLTGTSRDRGWLRPTATLSAVVLATSLAVVSGATPSFAATHARTASASQVVPRLRGYRHWRHQRPVVQRLGLPGPEGRGGSRPGLVPTSSSPRPRRATTRRTSTTSWVRSAASSSPSASTWPPPPRPPPRRTRPQKFTIVDYTLLTPGSSSNVPGPRLRHEPGRLPRRLPRRRHEPRPAAVGTFGGQDIPTVTIYMDGWVAGVRYYDKMNHAQ